MLNRGETLKLQGSERGVHRSADDLARVLPGVAARRAPRRRRSATPGCTSCCARTAKGLDTDAALKSALEHRLRRSCRSASTRRSSSRSATLRAALEAARRARSSLKMPLDALQRAARRSTRAATRCRWRSAARCARTGELDEAMQAFERAAALVPIATGDDSPHAQIAEIALEKKDQRARDRGAAGRRRSRLRQRRGGAAARGRCCARPSVTDPAQLRPVYERIVAIDPFDAEAHATLGRLALQRNDADAAIREFRTVLALSRSIRPRAYTDLAESYLQGRQARRGAASRRWPRSRSRRATSARRTCC